VVCAIGGLSSSLDCSTTIVTTQRLSEGNRKSALHQPLSRTAEAALQGEQVPVAMASARLRAAQPGIDDCNSAARTGVADRTTRMSASAIVGGLS
jgi:hypothetical protein